MKNKPKVQLKKSRPFEWAIILTKSRVYLAVRFKFSNMKIR